MTTAPQPPVAGYPPIPGYDPRLWRTGRWGWVHSWDTAIGVDGPGTRLTLFLAGCPLRCRYCENPDTWTPRGGRVTALEQVLEAVDTYRPALLTAGGGVTVSGGEPLAQPAFTTRFLQECKRRGLHTALDTSGFLGDLAGEDLLSATDLMLLDIKSSDPGAYRALTGRDLEPTLRFAVRCAERHIPVRVRFVLVPGVTDAPENVEGVARIAAGLGNVEQVDVLAYHRLGVRKYQALNIPYPLADTPEPSAEQLQSARRCFTRHGLPVT